jgi:hypothetical protein
MNLEGITVGAQARFATVLLFAFSVACESGDAPKAWNELSTCLAGSSASAELPKRVATLRLTQLNAAEANGTKEGWPNRCASHANALFEALPSSGQGSVMRRVLSGKLGCADEKASCTFPTDSSLISVTTELWEAAKGAQLKAEAAPGVKAPAPLPEPAITSATWKSFSPDPKRLIGPRKNADGSVVMLLAPKEGRGRPTFCSVPASADGISCVAGDKVPEIPLQGAELAFSEKGAHVAAVAETGLVAYDLATGAQSTVRGAQGGLVQDGLAVEGGTGDDGFLAIQMNDGKAGREVKLPVKVPLQKPTVVRDQVVWLEEVEGGVEFVAKQVTAGRVKDMAALKGPFSGQFHSCEHGDDLVVATWEKHAGQHGAKPTLGKDKTQLTLTQFSGGTWSKPLTAELPFERLIESELVCTPGGASMAFSHRKDGVIEVNRLDCTKDACKLSAVKLPGLDTKWWWAATPLGDKVLLAYRGGLGETRVRVAPLAGLVSAKDTLLFDAVDFGGPGAGEAATFASSDALLFVWKGERPVAMRVGADGSAKLLGAK